MKDKKLKLNKEVVAKLNDDSMRQIKGGQIAGQGSAIIWETMGTCVKCYTAPAQCRQSIAVCTSRCPKEPDPMPNTINTLCNCALY